MSVFLDQVECVKSTRGVPDGTYTGTWNGYTVRFETPAGTYEGRSTVSCRGNNVPCVVQVKCGQFKVTPRGDGTAECSNCGRRLLIGGGRRGRAAELLILLGRYFGLTGELGFNIVWNWMQRYGKEQGFVPDSPGAPTQLQQTSAKSGDALSFRVYWRMDGTDEIHSGDAARINGDRLEFTDGDWNPLEDCFLTEAQCRRHHGLAPAESGQQQA